MFAYLQAVAAACVDRGLVVIGVDNTSGFDGSWGGRLELVRPDTGGGCEAGIELRWSDRSGWQVALRQHSGPEVQPWRFLHVERAPAAEQVAGFAAGALRGEDLGMVYPARFRETSAGELMAQLRQPTDVAPAVTAAATPRRREDDV